MHHYFPEVITHVPKTGRRRGRVGRRGRRERVVDNPSIKDSKDGGITKMVAKKKGKKEKKKGKGKEK
jgi:hypothetical protein